MESAIFGLVGVVVGALLTVAKEWWFSSRKTRKEAEYLAIQVACGFERYAAVCADVVADDGLCEGRPNEHGIHEIQIKVPKFEPETFDVEWKSLPAALMYEVLNFPYQAELAGREVSDAFEYAATPPDFSEGFEERQLQYAKLGLIALELSEKLRVHARLPIREKSENDIAEYLNRHKADIEADRHERSTRYVQTDC
ncbi:hypothetical protein [Aeromonas enteropelogenes]|uniref:hypothetical protein n=1 Tax=Aeromonas enteropelogenes TaxID=29489 RepID=UPI000F53CA85|nr:hypothetical protein [Aeromonas enteropelogenes]RQM58637.1 hypothetical protein EHZ64_19340 [Aeromonas enteropelogenes]